MKNLLFIFFIFFSFYALANNCTKIDEQCIEPMQSKIINGYEVTKPCWRWQTSYECLTDNFTNNCASLEQNSSCENLSAKCIAKDNIANQCNEFQLTYKCNDLLNSKELNIKLLDRQNSIVKDELDFSRCNNIPKSCIMTEQNCISAGAIREINSVQISKECWEYQRNFNCVSDNLQSDCAQLDENCSYIASKCLVFSDDGNCTHYEKTYRCHKNNAQLMEQIICDADIYCIGEECEGQSYPANKNFTKAISYLNIIKDAGKTLDTDSLKIFDGSKNSCSKKPFAFNNCCKNTGWGQDISLASCSSQQIMLGQKIQAGQCHYVGAYCAEESAFGICLKKTQNYCCFQNKLGRIINEQARSQLNISWGSVTAPDCTGLTVEQMQNLDFEQMDFSQIYQQIQENTTIPSQQFLLNALENSFGELYEK